MIARRSRRSLAYSWAVRVSFPAMKDTLFVNLSVIDIIVLSPSMLGGSAKIKSRVIIRKGIGGDNMGCIALYGRCRRVWLT
jgi:hypothetical protein